MTNTPRIFLVLNRHDDSPHLIRALSKAAAQRHVVRDSFETRLATTEDLAKLLPQGIKIQAILDSGDTLE